MIKFLVVGSVLVLTACTDATVASIRSFGNKAHITCYSGGQVIYDGVSTGKVKATSQSDGWEFENSDGKFVRVSGDCVVIN